MTMELEQEAWRALALARVFMHDAPPLVEVDDLAAMVDCPRADLEPVLAHLEEQRLVLIQLRPGRVMGSAFVTQDGLSRWVQQQLAAAQEPLPGFRALAARIERCLQRTPFWSTEVLAAELNVAVSPLTAQLRVMEAAGTLKTNKQGGGVILSVTPPA
ncbi:hypothetical protein K7W42_13105 [Deinococcus sp. HMF7604]|uniref:hypothetical protein n=1 Tax=Deinococcus betulae TaxID=2873312 RepID=UPI001CCDE30E|nr:hypothetical protein [Deinococcus betulae]MBZ9751796.1 hypothetical protein [Deinococcus betulae]